MAVDTRNKRFAMLGFGQARGAPFVLPDPDGGNMDNFEERLQMIHMYSGIPPSDTIVPAYSENFFFRHRRGLGG